MMDPVVSSRYGKRPLLEIPPMSVTGYGQLEVPSLNLTGIGNNDYGTGGQADLYKFKTEFTIGGGGGLPPPPQERTRPYHTAPQAYPGGRQYFYGPNGEEISPNNLYHGVNRSHQTYPGVSTTSQQPYPDSHLAYPGVYNPYGSYQLPNQNPIPTGGPTGSVPKIKYDPSETDGGFNRITCKLEYGRIVNIDIRESRGEFKGIPPFLRDELLRTYGKYPFTEVKLKNENGEFHIYATHRDRRRGRRGSRDGGFSPLAGGYFDDAPERDYYWDDYDYDEGYNIGYRDYGRTNRRDPYFAEGFGDYR